MASIERLIANAAASSSPTIQRGTSMKFAPRNAAVAPVAVATEFIVTLETGQTITVVQDHAEGDAPLNVGDRVMVQIMGRNQRVLPAGALPTEVQRPQGVKLVD